VQIVPVEINDALVSSGLTQGTVPLWAPQWNPEFGEFSSDIATQVASRTKELRDVVAERLVAVCPQTAEFQVVANRGYLNIKITDAACIKRWSVDSRMESSRVVLTHPTPHVSGISYLRLGALAYVHFCLKSLVEKDATLQIHGEAKSWSASERSECIDSILISAKEQGSNSLTKESLAIYPEPIIAWISSQDLRGSFQDGFATDLFRDRKVHVRSPSKNYLTSTTLGDEWIRLMGQFPSETVAYLALRDEPTDELELAVPTLHEGANIFWNINFLLTRLETILPTLKISPSARETHRFRPFIEGQIALCSRTMLLWDAFIFEAANKGDVVSWAKMLRLFVESLHGVLNDAELRSSLASEGGPSGLIVLLSSAKQQLRDIISAFKL
jgi:hypothetical protein